MFDPTATFAQLNLLFAFLLRPFLPRCWRTLARTERALADAIRATLAEADVAVPDLSNAALIGWFNKHHPCSDETPQSVPEVTAALRLIPCPFQDDATAVRFIAFTQGERQMMQPSCRSQREHARTHARAPPRDSAALLAL